MSSQGVKNGNGRRKNGQKGAQKTSSSSDDESEDLAVVGASLSVSVNSVRQLIRAVLEGTEEFQNILYNECSLVFECKLCRNLFRSVANFISHKHRYCKKPYHYFHQEFHENEEQTEIRVPTNDGSERDKQKCAKSNSPDARSSRSRSASRESKPSVICELEEVPQSTVAKYQTILRGSIPRQSIHKELECLAEITSPKEITLSQDGHVMPFNDKDRNKCTSCDATFSSVIALKHHLALSHRTRTCYSCPLCKAYCSTPWGVYRHLSKVHNKSSEQVRKFRASVLSKPIKRQLHQQQQATQETRPRCDSTRTEDEKWRAQFDGRLKCAICRQTFTRHAALAVHFVKCKPKDSEVSTVCNKCGKQFSRKATLRVHQQSCKRELRTCKHCGELFPTPKQMEMHATRCPQEQPAKSPIRHLFTPPKLMIVQADPSSPSDIQVRMNYKIPAYAHVNIQVQPRAPKLENVVQKLRERPLFRNETVPNVQKPPPKINQPNFPDGVVVLKRVSVPLIDVKVEKPEEDFGTDSAAADIENRITESRLLPDAPVSECLPETPATTFCGFDPVNPDDCRPSERIKAIISKFEDQMDRVMLNVCNGLVGKPHSPVFNGIDKQIILRVDESFS